MKTKKITQSIDPKGVGNEMFKLMRRLYPICRSITGKGVEQTLNIIKESFSGGQIKVPPIILN